MRKKHASGDAIDELVLLQQLETIAELPCSIEERFDLAFLHASLHPATGITRLFDRDMHAYRVERLIYLTRAFLANMEEGSSYWSSLSVEAIGPLDDRRLFSDLKYRARIMKEYQTMLRTGLLSKPAE